MQCSAGQGRAVQCISLGNVQMRRPLSDALVACCCVQNMVLAKSAGTINKKIYIIVKALHFTTMQLIQDFWLYILPNATVSKYIVFLLHNTVYSIAF